MQKIDALNKSEALRYLGYGTNKPDKTVLELLNACEKKILDIARPTFTYKILDIEEIESGIKVVNTNLCLTGNDVKEHLKGCTKVVLMCATAGVEVDKLIRTSQVRKMSDAIILDALGSVLVEKVCNEAEKIIKEELKDYYFTWRYSPGYGDLDIGIQENFLDIVNAQRLIGVSVTKSNMLTPTKSVTAIIGLSNKQLNSKTRGCISCNMYERCKFRAGGTHCGF